MISACSPRRAHVVIDRATTYQALMGWEVTPRLGEFDKKNDRYDPAWLSANAAIVTALANEAGINRVRIEVRSGVENPVDYWSQFTAGKIGYTEVKSHFYEKVNDDADPNHVTPAGFQWSSFDYYVENFVLPLHAAVSARGDRLYINLCYVDFKWTDKKGSLSHAKSPDEYAELITAAALRLQQRYNLTPDAVEIILEPDNTDAWTGGAIANGLSAAKVRLAALGMHPTFIAPSPAHAYKTMSYLDAMRDRPDAIKSVGMVSYHRYDKTAADFALPLIRDRAKALNVPTAMLEYVDGSTDTFFSDMQPKGASAWQLYGAARPMDQDKVGYIVGFTADGRTELTRQFAQIAAVQKAVRAGARSLGARVQGPNKVLAFRNADGSEVIAIYSRGSTEFKIVGEGPGVYHVELVDKDGRHSTQDIEPDHVNALHLNLAKGSIAVLTRARPGV